MSNTSLKIEKKTIEQRRKEVWEAGAMVPAIEAYDKKHLKILDFSNPANTDIAYGEFYGKDIMDETPPPGVCGWCKKTKGEKETDCQCGRPPKYGEEIITKARQYLDSCKDEEDEFHKTRGEKSDGYERIVRVKLPSIEGLASYLDVRRSTLYLWEKSYPMFSDIIERLREKQAERLIDKGISGEYNSTIAKVILTRHGYREGIDATTNNKDLISIDEETKTMVNSALKQYIDGHRTDTKKQ